VHAARLRHRRGCCHRRMIGVIWTAGQALPGSHLA